MNRPLRDRLTALLAAAFFLLSGAGDVFGAHACPHHAAIVAPVHAGPSAAAHQGHHGHAAHGDAPAVPPEHDGHAACTCGGVCPVSSGSAPLAGRTTIDLPLALAPAALAAPGGGEELPSRLVPHFLPFAQAPPPSA